MDQEYTVEALETTFLKHAEIAEDNFKKQIEVYKMECGDELPEYLTNTFNLAKALSVMCYEIEKLKKNTGCE